MDSNDKHILNNLDLIENLNCSFAFHKIVLDENNTPIDYVFLEINKKFEEFIGLKKENIIGKSVLDLFPKTEKHWIENFGKVALTKIPFNTIDYSSELNRYYDVKAYSTRKNYFAATFYDISELIKRENAFFKNNILLYENQLKYKSFIEKSPISIFSTDKIGNFIFSNKNFQELIGYSESELLKMSLRDIVLSKNLKKDIAKFELLKKTGISHDKESVFVSKSGKKIHFILNSIKISSDEYIAFCNDISERKRVEEKLYESETRLKKFHDASFGGIGIHDKGLILDCIKGFPKYQAILTMN